MVFTSPPRGCLGYVHLTPSSLQGRVPDIYSERVLRMDSSTHVACLTSRTIRRFSLESGEISLPLARGVREVALPLVMKQYSPTQAAKNRAICEWNYHMLVRGGPFIPIPYFLDFIDEQRACIAMEYLGPQNMMQQYVYSYSSLPRKDFVAFAYLLLRGVKYFHEKGILHCDLKERNLVFWEDGRDHIENLPEGEENLPIGMQQLLRKYCFKIFDFGLCHEEGTQINPVDYDVQSPNYRSARGILSGRVTWQHELTSVAAIYFGVYASSVLFYYSPQVLQLFSQEGLPQHSLLQLYYTNGFTKTPSQETIASFYRENPERVLRFYTYDPEDEEGIFFRLKLSYNREILYSGSERKKKSFSWENFLEDVAYRREEQLQRLATAAARKGDTIEWCRRLVDLIDKFLDADHPPSSFEELFTDPFFTKAFQEMV